MQESKEISAYRQSLRDIILRTAMRAFARKGIRAVKMDDIARQLVISKRTLYELYDNKELLLLEGVKRLKSAKEREMVVTMSRSRNVMDIILYIYKVKVDEFKQVNPLFYEDIKKYPTVKRFFDDDKQNSTRRMQQFLSRGVAEGYFRRDLDYDLVLKTFDLEMNEIIQTQLYLKYSIEDIFRNIIFVKLRGICTPMGVSALDTFQDALTK